MNSENSYESFLRERWFAVSQDAARAEALLEMLIEQEPSDCRIPRHLRNHIEKFLACRRERRKAAQDRLDVLELEREKEGNPDYDKDIGKEIARRAKP